MNGGNSVAEAISDSGDIVGQSGDDAFLYSDGTMLDLNDLIDPSSGWTLNGADGINAAGQIVGDGINPDGASHAFLLTPVPEPASLSLLAITGVALAGRRRRGA